MQGWCGPSFLQNNFPAPRNNLEIELALVGAPRLQSSEAKIQKAIRTYDAEMRECSSSCFCSWNCFWEAFILGQKHGWEILFLTVSPSQFLPTAAMMLKLVVDRVLLKSIGNFCALVGSFQKSSKLKRNEVLSSRKKTCEGQLYQYAGIHIRFYSKGTRRKW